MIDKEKIEQAVHMILEAIGEDTSREGLIDTPRRVANMFEELTSGKAENPKTHLSKTFNVETSDLVLEKDIDFTSTCEHHLMPFFGKVAICYIPNGKVVGLSKLARTVDTFSKRLQLQEQLCNQIAKAVYTELNAKGVMVVITAEHTCMTCRGVKKIGSKTTSIATFGEFKNNESLQLKVLQMI